MSDEFDLLYDTASGEAPGLDEFEKSMFLTKGMYELTEKRFDEYMHNASRGFHDDEINRDNLKGFIASAVVEVEKTPTISSSKAAAEGYITAGHVVDPHSYQKYKIEKTTKNSYFFQRPSDSMGVIHEDVILRPKVKTKKLSKDLVANVTPIRYDHLDRLMKNPFMKPRYDLAFRLDHSDYDGTSLSEIVCDQRYSAFQYRVKYVKRPYPIILVNLQDEYSDDEVSIESQVLPYLEPKFEDNIRKIADLLRYDKFKAEQDSLYSLYYTNAEIQCTAEFDGCELVPTECEANYTICKEAAAEMALEKSTLEAEIKFPPLYGLSLEEIKVYIIANTDADSAGRKELERYLKISQATNIDITLHHDIVQRGVELAILHYRENTLQNNMQAKIKQNHPEIVALFVKPQSKKVWLERMQGRLE